MIIEHVGIAVASIDESLKVYRDCLGLAVSGYHDVPDDGVRIAMIPVGDSRIELLEPTGPETPVGRFLARRGPGIHHIAVRVDDIETALERFRQCGARLIDETPRRGAGGARIAFVHPSSTQGVLLELVEDDA